MDPLTTTLPSRPTDATLTVTKAARLLGVHPNTVRAWSDAGRLRYYRINPRGDRRYRLGDLQRFLAAAEGSAGDPGAPAAGLPPGGRRGGPFVLPTNALGAERGSMAAEAHIHADPMESERETADLALIDRVTRLATDAVDLDEDLSKAVAAIREAHDRHLVAIWELRGIGWRHDPSLVPRMPRRIASSTGRAPSGSSARRSRMPSWAMGAAAR